MPLKIHLWRKSRYRHIYTFTDSPQVEPLLRRSLPWTWLSVQTCQFSSRQDAWKSLLDTAFQEKRAKSFHLLLFFFKNLAGFHP